ncbi:ATP-binding protein [Peptacetobacter hiranonis]|uniref:ATP-binding protein n=1 Tax=Peptacetobacter hiranonis TaxID=89152 RepID=UPI0022E8523F|nr:4Fe-4S binding protein [Peptacetobacter hiranonis]
MIRRIININEEKCNGCGLCADACHEGAIGMIDGKAKLLRDDYCDGLGDCLPVCPTGAISFEEREAAEYDEVAVKKRMEEMKKQKEKLPCGCPGSQSREIKRENNVHKIELGVKKEMLREEVSCLSQWPVQIKLAPINAPYFNGAKLLIAADCTAYAYAKFHEDFIKGHVTLIGCPKLDEGDYSEKLTEIIKNNDIKSVKIVKMEVPCCKGIERAAITAMKNSGKFLPWQVVTISTDGFIVE